MITLSLSSQTLRQHIWWRLWQFCWHVHSHCVSPRWKPNCSRPNSFCFHFLRAVKHGPSLHVRLKLVHLSESAAHLYVDVCPGGTYKTPTLIQQTWQVISRRGIVHGRFGAPPSLFRHAPPPNDATSFRRTGERSLHRPLADRSSFRLDLCRCLTQFVVVVGGGRFIVDWPVGRRCLHCFAGRSV